MYGYGYVLQYGRATGTATYDHIYYCSTEDGGIVYTLLFAVFADQQLSTKGSSTKISTSLATSLLLTIASQNTKMGTILWEN